MLGSRAAGSPPRLVADALAPGHGPPDRRQTVGGWIYEITQTQIAEQGLPTKAIARWFPYVASLALFIWVDEHDRLRTAALGRNVRAVGRRGAADAQDLRGDLDAVGDSITLALMTFVFTHIEGIRANGAAKYFKGWIPEVPKAMYRSSSRSRSSASSCG